MNLHRFYICFSILLSSFAIARNNRIDSLLRVLSSSLSDTARISATNELAVALRRSGECDSSVKYCNHAISLISACPQKNSVPVKKMLSDSYQCLAICTEEESRYDEATQLFLKALQLRRETGYRAGEASTLNSLGMIKRELGNYREALDLHLQSVAICRQIKDFNRLASALNECGIVNDYLGDYAACIRYYYAALKIFELLGDKDATATIALNIALIYQDLEEFQSALQYDLMALKLREQLGNKKAIAFTLNNVGNLYSTMGARAKDTATALKLWDTARTYLETGLKIREETGNKPDIASSLTNLGNLYDFIARVSKNGSEKDKMMKKSLDYNLRSLKFNEEAGTTNKIISGLLNVGVTYVVMKEYAKGESYYKRGLALAKEHGYKSRIASFYIAMWKLYEEKKDFRSAYDAYKLHVLYTDSMNNEENVKRLVQTQMQYDFDKKQAGVKAEQDKKNALAAEKLRQQKQQRNYFIAGFVLVLVLCCFVMYSFLQKKKANKLLEDKNRVIELQKFLVEEKQKEILDSIYYASRIQRALITSERYISAQLKRLGNM